MARITGSKTGTRSGAKRTLYLDDATITAARDLGKGSVSEGIRRAVALADWRAKHPDIERFWNELQPGGQLDGVKP